MRLLNASTALLFFLLVESAYSESKSDPVPPTEVQVSASAESGPPVPGEWKQTFYDNFNDPELSHNRWKIGMQYLGKLGLANNSEKNVSVKDGKLIITAAITENIEGQGGEKTTYKSGEISTFRLFRQKYGYFEARIKYDTAVGLWPAFWLMPDRGNYGNQNYRFETYLKFNTSDFPKDIQSAYLELHLMNEPKETTLSLYPMESNDWNESSINWSNKPPYAVKWLDRVNIKKGQKSIRFSIKEFINENNTDGFISFSIVDNYMKDEFLSFFSKDHHNSDMQPRLIINGIPFAPSDDTYTRAGAFESQNYGHQESLNVKDPWGDTSSTKDGGMEFDIMETLAVWGPHTTSHAIHWDGYGDKHKATGSGHISLNSSAEDFHIYGLYWKPGYIATYVDNKKTWEYKSERVSTIPAYIILSLQIGGWDNNSSVDVKSLPSRMEVDYVRVWSQ